MLVLCTSAENEVYDVTLSLLDWCFEVGGYIMCESSWKHFSSDATERNHEEKETTAS